MAHLRNVEDVLYGSRHEHKLCLAKGLQVYTCSGCKAFGTNEGFKCRSCPNFVLHKDCAVLPDEYRHPFLSQHPFKFRPKTLLRHYCDGCGNVVRGFVFESSGANLKLHPLCMALPAKLSYSGHKNHALDLVIEEEETYRCMQCNKENLKWKYQCKRTACNVNLDMNCAIVYFHGLSKHGINLSQRPSRVTKSLEKLAGMGNCVVSMWGNNTFPGSVEDLSNAGMYKAVDDDEGGGVDDEGGEEAGEEGGGVDDEEGEEAGEEEGGVDDEEGEEAGEEGGGVDDEEGEEAGEEGGGVDDEEGEAAGEEGGSGNKEEEEAGGHERASP